MHGSKATCTASGAERASGYRAQGSSPIDNAVLWVDLVVEEVEAEFVVPRVRIIATHGCGIRLAFTPEDRPIGIGRAVHIEQGATASRFRLPIQVLLGARSW